METSWLLQYMQWRRCARAKFPIENGDKIACGKKDEMKFRHFEQNLCAENNTEKEFKKSMKANERKW